jgi:hypothetical protein
MGKAVEVGRGTRAEAQGEKLSSTLPSASPSFCRRKDGRQESPFSSQLGLFLQKPLQEEFVALPCSRRWLWLYCRDPRPAHKEARVGSRPVRNPRGAGLSQMPSLQSLLGA